MERFLNFFGFCFHNWSKWEFIKNTTLKKGLAERVTRTYDLNKKTCTKCGHVRYKEVKNH